MPHANQRCDRRIDKMLERVLAQQSIPTAPPEPIAPIATPATPAPIAPTAPQQLVASSAEVERSSFHGNEIIDQIIRPPA